jgi:Xaa-Pro dipeptidase
MSEPEFADFTTSQLAALAEARQQRLRRTMRALGVAALVTADPIDILYACGARNMTVFGMMAASRFVLVFADGPTILYEFAGCEHLAAGLATVDEIRVAPGVTALSGARYHGQIQAWAVEVLGIYRQHVGGAPELAIAGFDHLVTDAFRSIGARITDAGPVFVEARRIKQPIELAAMREAIRRIEAAAEVLEASITEGAKEVEVWAEFHRHLIANEGEFVSTRLFQSGPKTFPYFQEAGSRRMQRGELICFDTDALGYLNYAVDFSRTFVCGSDRGTAKQREFYTRAHEQLAWNGSLLKPGLTYEDFARAAWPIPDEHQQHGYYCLAHGLGLCGEFPYIPHAEPGAAYPFEGAFEPGMVVCIESYIGQEGEAEGVKLEDQFLITETGVERMTTYPFDDRLLDVAVTA